VTKNRSEGAANAEIRTPIIDVETDLGPWFDDEDKLLLRRRSADSAATIFSHIVDDRDDKLDLTLGVKQPSKGESEVEGFADSDIINSVSSEFEKLMNQRPMLPSKQQKMKKRPRKPFKTVDGIPWSRNKETAGSCFLQIFKPKYHERVARKLTLWPTPEELIEVYDDNPDWRNPRSTRYLVEASNFKSGELLHLQKVQPSQTNTRNETGKLMYHGEVVRAIRRRFGTSCLIGGRIEPPFTKSRPSDGMMWRETIPIDMAEEYELLAKHQQKQRSKITPLDPMCELHHAWSMFRLGAPVLQQSFEAFAWICFCVNFMFDHAYFWWIGVVVYTLGSFFIRVCSFDPMRNADPKVPGQCALNAFKRPARKHKYKMIPAWPTLGMLISVFETDEASMVDTITVTARRECWTTFLHIEAGGSHPIQTKDLKMFLSTGKIPTPSGFVLVTPFTPIGGKSDLQLGMMIGAMLPFVMTITWRFAKLTYIYSQIPKNNEMMSDDPQVEGQCVLSLWKPEHRKAVSLELPLDPQWQVVFLSTMFHYAAENDGFVDQIYVSKNKTTWHVSDKPFEGSFVTTPQLLREYVISKHARWHTVGRLTSATIGWTFQFFWLSIAFYWSMMNFCFSSLVMIIASGAAISVWLMCQQSRIEFVFMTFGSRGDVVPVQYYVTLLERLGLNVRLKEYDGMSGSEILRLTEQGRYDMVVPHYVQFIMNVKEQINHGCIVFAPIMGYKHPRLLSYAVSPIPGAIRSFNLYGESHFLSIINRISDAAHAMNTPGIRIGSFKGCWPRSADGTSLITPVVNRGTRRRLITLGSSSLDVPEGYNPATTWCTKPGTQYQYEHRTNHAEIFADYQMVLCHGGAGTVATAKACGCTVISLSDLLDRSVIDSHPYEFSQDISCVHYDLSRLLPLNDAITYFAFIVRKNPFLSWKMGLILMWRCYIQWLSNMHSITILLVQLAPVIGMTRLDTHSIYRLFQGTHVSLLQSVMITAILHGSFQGLQRKKGMWWMWLKIKPNVAPFLLYYTGAMGTISMVTLQSMFGYLGGIIVHYIVVERACFSEILLAQAKVVLTAAGSSMTSWAVPSGPCIKVRFQPFQAWWLPWYIPAFHTEFVNPSLKMAAGITCENQRCRFYHHSSDDKRRVAFTLPTTIPLDKWPELCGLLARADGEIYTPLNHCQTNLFKALWNKGENSLTMGFLAISCFTAILLLGFMGSFVVVPLLCLNWLGFEWAKGALREFTPAIAFAGLQPFKVQNMSDILKFLFSPSTMMFEGPKIVLAPDQYPKVPVVGCSLLPSSAQLMRINIGGRGHDFWQPFIGMNRPNYKRGRKPGYELIHSIDADATEDVVTSEQWDLVSQLHQALPSELPEDVAVVAISGERNFDGKHLAWLLKTFKMVIVLTNDDREVSGCVMIKLAATGRELAALRLAMPHRKRVYWYSFNSEYQHNANLGPVKLWEWRNLLKKSKYDFASVIPFGLHQCAAGIMMYKECLYDSSDLNFEIYGSDEYSAIKKDGLIFVPLSLMLMSLVRKEMDFPCKRKVHLYDNVNGSIKYQFEIERWGVKAMLPAMSSAAPPNGRAIELDENGFIVNGVPVNMAPIVSEMYPTGTPVEDVLVDIQSNLGAFFHRVRKGAEGLMKDAQTAPVSRDLIASYAAALTAFNRGGRPPKSIWAPIQRQLKGLRSEELGISLHPNPTFVTADFDTTLMHYVSRLNQSIGNSGNPNHRQEPLTPTQFRRRVNRNPYVDTYLQSSMPDAFDAGHDASSIACKEIMLASLARYNKSGFVDALTDTDVNEIVEVMFKRNPGLYDSATISSPYKLTRRFLKFKKYSAGLPFTYDGSGIKNRADLRRAGMLKPIIDAALEPYITGQWYPALAHSFPKSQVIDVKKIVEKPEKMRTVVATSGINNVQQGVLNFDVNNRHDFMSSNEKVAMPLSGSHMIHVFADLKSCNHLYSADVTAMDSVISDGVFQVIAGLRKKGFEKHPAYEVIAKHIECSIEQTKHAYVVNLIGDKLGEFELPSVYDGVSDEKWEELKKVSQLPCFKDHEAAPGGVLQKRYGGSTGDSNVTFNNTKALPIILMYSFCKANNWDYAEFFDKVPLHNFGDDNLFGLDDEKQLQDVMDIAQRDLGVTLRIESKGTSVYDQQFLGRRPVPVEPFKHEFEQAGIPVPEFAIVNDTTTMKMRFASEKIESTRHKGTQHEIYRLEKCLGYLNLCAHDPEFYDIIVNYMDVVKARLPSTLLDAKWFKAKFKVPSYSKILQLWYKPIQIDKVEGVHALRISVGLMSKTESALLRITRFLGLVCDVFPAHLVTGGECDTLRVTNLTSGIFEAHAWHCFVVENERPPSLIELRGMISDSPFAAFTDAYQWMATVGCILPTRGPLFTRNRNHAIFRLLIYTTVYMNINRMASNASVIPLGNVLLDLFNLVMFKSRNLFGSLGYSYYLGKGKSSPTISGLMPKDPYLYHKRAAIIVDQLLPKLSLLGVLPFGDMMDAAAICSEEFSKLFTTTMFQNVTPALRNETINDSPWSCAVTDALEHVKEGRCPMLTAHTGTGKTKYTPGLVLRNTILPTSQVVVLMPRNIICEQWSATSGALYKRKGVNEISELVTCTYGYLAHCFAHGNHWWAEDAFFLFDEAHEESIEWRYLRRNFMMGRRCMCLTATPLATACAAFPRVVVDVEPLFTIDTVDFIGDMKEAISSFIPSANRMVVIEPSLKRCRRIADMIKSAGFAVKVVHSGDRVIPEGVHIVATSVIEASITIPGADYIIDSGERIVNDGGTLMRVANDIPGMIQRKGRTGRTNNGTYVSLMKPVNRYYEPVPDMTLLLAKHPIVDGSKVTLPFEMNNGSVDKRLEGDYYVKLKEAIPDVNVRRSVSLLHKIKIATNNRHEEHKAYVNLAKGHVVDDYMHLLLTCGVVDTSKLCRYEECEANLIKAQPHYIVNGRRVGSIPTIKNWGIRLADDPTTWLSARARSGKLDTIQATTIKE
jgi:hypothetical protein